MKTSENFALMLHFCMNRYEKVYLTIENELFTTFTPAQKTLEMIYLSKLLIYLQNETFCWLFSMDHEVIPKCLTMSMKDVLVLENIAKKIVEHKSMPMVRLMLKQNCPNLDLAVQSVSEKPTLSNLFLEEEQNKKSHKK